MIRSNKVKIWSLEEREQYLQNGQAVAPVKEAVTESTTQPVIELVEPISFFDQEDAPVIGEPLAAVTPTESAVRVVPQPDANGEFATPAEGAKFMASFDILQTPLNGKKPFLKDWQNTGSTDFAQIDAWYAQYKCNFGSIAKAEVGGFYAVETDSPVPHAEYQKETGERFSAKLMNKSGEGRAHWWFRHTKESIALGNIGQVGGDEFSLRLNNEQCVSPGSIHPVRKTQYANMVNGAPQSASHKLIAWLSSKKKQVKKIIEADSDGGPILEGGRNASLTSYAGKLRNNGLNVEEILAILTRMNEERCQPPLPESEIEVIANSVARYKVPPPDVVIVNGQLAGTSPRVATTAPAEADRKRKASEEEMEKEDRKTKYVRAISIEEYKEMVDITKLFHRCEGEGQRAILIPPFDVTTMTGLAKDMTLLAIKGTTLLPQFVYGMAKTLITARMAGNIIMEGVSAEPTRYFVAVGETGTGKGEAWRRLLQIMQPEGVMDVDGCGLKFINSADSGAGLKDFFFHPPEDWPVICYVDEIASLGNKTTDKKQPEILDTIIELADSTTISRVLADRKGERQVRTKNNAQLAIVACGQDGKAYGQAFGMREKQGIFDRLTPEYGESTEAGDLDRIDPEEAFEMLQRFKALPYKAVASQEIVGVSLDSGNPITKPKFKKQRMTLSVDARELLDAFWKEQPKQVKDKARFRKNLMLEAFYNAFGNSRLSVEAGDMQKAIQTFTRELAIRAKHFNTPIGDRISFYSALIKETTEEMIVRLVRGDDLAVVAQTKRDYLTKTNAYRNNEEHLFFRAWISHEKDYLIPIKIQVGRNRRWVEKYLPAPID